MFADIQETSELKTGNHALLLREIRREIRRHHILNSRAALEEAMESAPKLDDLRLRRRKKTGTLLTVLPYTVNRTDMGDQERCNTQLLCYIIDLPDFSFRYDG